MLNRFTKGDIGAPQGGLDKRNDITRLQRLELGVDRPDGDEGSCLLSFDPDDNQSTATQLCERHRRRRPEVSSPTGRKVGVVHDDGHS